MTERGRPKALLGPVPGRAPIAEGVAAGAITSAAGGALHHRGGAPKPPPAAEVTGVGTLDPPHLAAARRIDGPGATSLTFDLHQAQAARAPGVTVVGA